MYKAKNWLIAALLVPLSCLANDIELVVLGIAQDASYPQINCYKPHCMPAWKNDGLKQTATSLAVINHKSKEKLLFEATPNMPEQLYKLHTMAPDTTYQLNGVFLTHAHIGHYTGLMYFGREAAGSKNMPVYAMPAMTRFIKENGPWSQLVKLNNIALNPLQAGLETQISGLSITPLVVPHRDEFSETVGFLIKGPNKVALFIPDIDKWDKWTTDISTLVTQVDYAFLDATFYDNHELPNRDMSEVPHPFVVESMKKFEHLTPSDKKKVHFIHLNHSNPMLDKNSEATKVVLSKGFSIAREGLIVGL